MGRRAAILRINFGALEGALHFPDEHRIVGVRMVDTFTDRFEVLVESPHFKEIDPSQEFPRVDYVVTVDEGTDLVPTKAFVGKFSGDA